MINAATRARFALGRLKAGTANQLEVQYALHLEERKRSGEVAWYKFEALKLRLADNTFYTPDYAVMLTSGELQCHEVKGFMQEDAAVKIKVAAETYPIRFLLIRKRAKRDGGGWLIKDIGNGL